MNAHREPSAWFQALPVAAALVDPGDGRLLQANPQFAALFGAVAAPAAPQGFDALAKDSGELAALRNQVAAGGRPKDREVDCRCRAADGSSLRILVCLARTNAQDAEAPLIAVFADVTERGERKRELAEMARFPEMNPAPVLRFDLSGAVALANGAARRLFGGEDLLGRRWPDLCPEIDEVLWQRILSEPYPPTVEARFGERCILFTHVRTESGESVFAFGAETTAFRNAERTLTRNAAELKEIARFPDMNPGPVIRTDTGGSILLANAAARTVFGELDGNCWLDICPGLGADAWQGILASEQVVPVEARVGDADFVFAHRSDARSGLVFVFGADVTRQKQTERALRQAEKMATLGTLAAGVAHELNNPAAATRRAADQLRDAFSRLDDAHILRDRVAFTPAQQDAVVALDRAARDAAGRSDDLDAMARSDAEAAVEEWLESRDVPRPWELASNLVRAGMYGAELDKAARDLEGDALTAALAWVGAAFPVYSLAVEIGQGSGRISEIVSAMKSYSYLGQAPVQEVDLREGLDSTLVILRSKLKEGVTVHREYSESLPRVPAWGSELNQVWTNLIDNAVDAMNASGALTIRTREEEPWAVVEIEDSGPGIEADVLPRIFDPFFTTKAPGKGMGLGLSTTYSIVTEKHKGRIAVDSRPGFTRFTVKLPLRAGA